MRTATCWMWLSFSMLIYVSFCTVWLRQRKANEHSAAWGSQAIIGGRTCNLMRTEFVSRCFAISHAIIMPFSVEKRREIDEKKLASLHIIHVWVHYFFHSLIRMAKLNEEMLDLCDVRRAMAWWFHWKYFEYSKRKIWPDINSLHAAYHAHQLCTTSFSTSTHSPKMRNSMVISLFAFSTEHGCRKKNPWRSVAHNEKE